MARPAQDVTDAELAVLQALWDRGRESVRGLADAIYGEAGSGPSRLATVQKLLERLEAKGFVERDRTDAGPQLFHAVVDRGDLIGRRLREVAEKLCGGSLTPLLTHLVESEPLKPTDRKALRSLIDRLDSQSKRPRTSASRET